MYVLAIAKNFFGVDDGIDSRLEHLILPKGQIFYIGEKDS